MPIPSSILALVPHKAKYMDIWHECIAAGLTTAESRAYANLEIDSLIAKGLLKGPRQSVLMVIGGKPQVVQLSAPVDPTETIGGPTDDMPELPPNPATAPQKIDRRKLKLKARAPAPPPRFPFIKSRA